MTKRFKNIFMGILISCVSLAIVPTVQAAEDDAVAQAIKARQAGMGLYSFYAGQLFAMAKGEQEYNADLAATLANNLVAVTELSNGMMWLPESDNTARQGKTRALPEIWGADSNTGDKAQTLKDAALGLSLVAGDGLDALRGEIGAVGEACDSCHEDYRAEDF